jgi:hypothetical protein
VGQFWQEPRPAAGTSPAVTENVARTWGRDRRVAPLAVLGIAALVAAGVVAWLLLFDGGSSGPAPRPATIVSQAQLEQVAASVDHPVFWAGPKQGYSYELTTTANGRFYVRYLPRRVKAGDPRPNFLVVGTYTQPDSYPALKRVATRGGGVLLRLGKGGIALVSPKAPTSVYFSYRDANYQVEVFNPSEDHARKLVLGGKIVPIK